MDSPDFDGKFDRQSLDIFDFSDLFDFFDFRCDVSPEIKDLRTRGFGLWLAFSSSESIREVKHHAGSISKQE
jgi:hypothetical protein